jgi:hypothetical protein
MEEPKNVEPGDDVIDSFGVVLPYEYYYGRVSIPEKIIGARDPDSSVSLGCGIVASGTPKSSISCNTFSQEMFLGISQLDVKVACPMSQDNDMSSR